MKPRPYAVSFSFRILLFDLPRPRTCAVEELLDLLVEVGLELELTIVGIIFLDRLRICRFPRNESVSLEDLKPPEREEGVDALGKLHHCKRLLAQDQTLDMVEESRYREFKLAD